MEKIAIISDVNAGLDYIGRDPQIPMLRSIINFGDQHFIDGKEITATEFYEKLQREKVIPSTSAPTIGEAMEYIEKYISEGYTDVIMYSISYKLSSIGQMVETLKSEYEGQINIHVVDTKSATYQQGFVAMEAKRMVDEGKSVKEIIDWSNYLIANSHAYFVVDDLNFLVKNGRLSGAAGFVGGLLKIKPVLEMTEDGRIISFEKVRVHKKAVERMIELVLDKINGAKKVQLFVYHTVRFEDAQNIMNSLKATLPESYSIEIHTVTPAVGAHIGCGILGLGYFILEK